MVLVTECVNMQSHSQASRITELTLVHGRNHFTVRGSLLINSSKVSGTP